MRVPRVVRFGRGRPEPHAPAQSRRSRRLRSVAADLDRRQEPGGGLHRPGHGRLDGRHRGRRGLRPLRPQRRDGQHQGDRRSGPQPQRRDPLGYRVVPSRRRGALRLHDLADRGAALSRRRSRDDLDRRRPATVRSSPSPSRPTRARGRSRSTAPTATAGSPSSPKRAPRSPSWPKRTRRARTARRRSNSSRSFTPKSSTTSPSRRGTWFRPRRPTCSTWSSPKTAPPRMSRPWA